MKKVLLPILKGLDPNVLAKDICSVQPMSGPTAQIFTMRTRYSDVFSGKTYTWQDHLATVNREYYDLFSKEKIDPKFKLMKAIESMQEKFPGEYTLEEYYDTEKGRFKLKMVFDVPEEESMFIMRYSEK